MATSCGFESHSGHRCLHGAMPSMGRAVDGPCCRWAVLSVGVARGNSKRFPVSAYDPPKSQPEAIARMSSPEASPRTNLASASANPSAVNFRWSRSRVQVQ